MCAFASKWCVRGVRPGSVSILYVPCVRVRVSGGGSVWGGGQLPEPTPRTPPLTNKRTHSACMMGQQPDPTPRTPPLTNKRTHGACMMGQEPDPTPRTPPLANKRTHGACVMDQEPDPTPRTPPLLTNARMEHSKKSAIRGSEVDWGSFERSRGAVFNDPGEQF